MKKLLFTLGAMLIGWGVQAAAAPTLSYQFIENKGQWPTQVRFAADMPGGRLFLEPTGFSYNLQASEAGHHTNDATGRLVRGHSFRARLLEARVIGAAIGEQRLPTYHNYFIGNEPAKWAAHVPLYEAVRYRQLYPGVDMVWHTAASQLKYDYKLVPGTDPALIRLQYDGLDGLEVVDGALRLRTSVGLITEQVTTRNLRQPANIITPNGNRKNDDFRLLGVLQGAELRVFNRWGKQVYHTARYDNKWHGDTQPAGVYHYFATRPECGLTYKGWLEITR